MRKSAIILFLTLLPGIVTFAQVWIMGSLDFQVHSRIRRTIQIFQWDVPGKNT